MTPFAMRKIMDCGVRFAQSLSGCRESCTLWKDLLGRVLESMSEWQYETVEAYA